MSVLTAMAPAALSLAGMLASPTPVAPQLGLTPPPSYAKRHMRNLKRLSAGKDTEEVDHFVIRYGDGSAWYLGIIGQDAMDFGGSRAGNQQFGLIEFDSYPIGNNFPDSDGQPATDGIMGLNPGCLGYHVCPDGTDDVISTLVKAGALRSYGFTMCHGEQGGGKLFLGLPEESSFYPKGTSWVPLQPFRAQTGNQDFTKAKIWYSLQAPHDDSDSDFFFGNTRIGRVTAEYLRRVAYIFDSGTYGLEVPPQVADTVFSTVAKVWFANDQVREALVSNGVRSEKELLSLFMQRRAAGLELSKEVASVMMEMVPDFVMRTSGTDLTTSGSTFLYEETKCAGTYSVSWAPGYDDGSIYATVGIGGTSFLIGKTITYDVSDIQAPKLGVLNAAGSCQTDYSQDQQIIEMSGSRAQILQVGVYTADVLLGSPAQKFTVQLDTGSPDLLVQSSSCVGFAPECVEFSYFRPDSMSFASTGNCDETTSGAFNAAALAKNPQTHVKFGEFEKFAAEHLQPARHCSALREACGDLKAFDIAASSTFETVPHGAQMVNKKYVHPPPELHDPNLVCEPCKASVSAVIV